MFLNASSPKNSKSANVRFTTFCDPRNEPDYDTYEYGTEPIPGDATWVQPRTLRQLHARVSDTFAQSGTINSDYLATLAILEILNLSDETLAEIRRSSSRYPA